MYHFESPGQGHPARATPQMRKLKTCWNSAVEKNASKKAVDALIDLSELTAAAAALGAAAAADPASIYAVDMVRPSSPRVLSRMFDHMG